MKILFCSVPCDSPNLNLTVVSRQLGELPVLPKMAIISLINWLSQNGYNNEDYDFLDIDMLLPSNSELERYFASIKPNIVGLSAVTSGSYSQVKRISAIIKKVCPNAIVVLGGNLSASAEVVLHKTDVDICVVGDGEISFLNLVNFLKENALSYSNLNIAQIQGLAFLDYDKKFVFTGYGKKLSEGDVPYVPDYDLLRIGLKGNDELMQNYFLPGYKCSWFKHDKRTFETHRRKNIANVFTNKGCVAKCTFCQRSTKGYGQIQISALEHHLQSIIDIHDVGFIHVCDENFGSNKAHAFEFAQLMKKYDLLWFASGVRCDTVSESSIDFFKNHNCVALKFGVESGSQKILNIMEKKFKLSQVKQAIHWCRSKGIYSPLAIMFGMPGENLNTARETGSFLAEMALQSKTDWINDPIDIFYAIPFPGTPLYEYGQQIGIIPTAINDAENFLENLYTAPSPKLSYVNLNGAPIYEALAWDLIAQVNASNHFYSTSIFREGISSNHTDSNTSENSNIGITIYLPTNYFSKFKSAWIWTKLLFSGYPIISQLLQNKFVRSRLAGRLPVKLSEYTIMILVYIEYYIVVLISICNNNYNYKHINTYSKISRLDDNFDASYTSKRNPSIRTIVQENRGKLTSNEENNKLKIIGGI